MGAVNRICNKPERCTSYACTCRDRNWPTCHGICPYEHKRYPKITCILKTDHQSCSGKIYDRGISGTNLLAIEHPISLEKYLKHHFPHQILPRPRAGKSLITLKSVLYVRKSTQNNKRSLSSREISPYEIRTTCVTLLYLQIYFHYYVY